MPFGISAPVCLHRRYSRWQRGWGGYTVGAIQGSCPGLLETDAALLIVQAEESQWVMKADGYLRLEVQAGVMDCAVWDLVQEETGV
jgi:hypothetical protein